MVSKVWHLVARVILVGAAAVFVMGAKETGSDNISKEMAPVPDWVDNLSLEIPPLKSQEKHNDVFLFNDLQVRYRPDARDVYRRFVWRSNDPGDNNIFDDAYDVNLSDIVIHHVTVTKPDRQQLNLAMSDLLPIGKDWLQALLAPNLEKGDIVDASFTQTFSGSYQSSLLFERFSVGARKEGVVRVRICGPADHQFTIKNTLFESEAASVVIEANTCYVLTENFTGDAAIDSETEWAWASGEIQIETIADWQDLSAEIHRRSTVPHPQSLELLKLAHEFDQEGETSLDKFGAMVLYFQRYFHARTQNNILTDYEWLKPNMKDVLKYRKCIDFECLAMAQDILNELDIDSELYLVWSGNHPKYGIISLEKAYDSRLVLRVPIEDSVYWISFSVILGVDLEYGSDQFVPFDADVLLPITSKGADPIVAERLPSTDPTSQLRSTYTISDDEDSWTLEEIVLGDYLYVDNVQYGDKRQVVLERGFPGIKQTKSIYFESDEDGVPDKTTHYFSLPKEWRVNVSSKHKALGFVVEQLPKLFREEIEAFNENSDALSQHPVYNVVKTTLERPAVGSWDTKSFEESVVNEYFDFSLSQKFDGQKLERTYTYKTLKKWVDDEDREMLVADLERALELVRPWSVSYQPVAE